MQSLFAHAKQSLQLNITKTEPPKKQAKKSKKGSETTIYPPKSKNRNTQENKSEKARAIVRDILKPLTEGKIEQALESHYSNRQHKISGKSRFLHGLNFAATNNRKALWISSFCGDIQTNSHPSQRTVIQFTTLRQ